MARVVRRNRSGGGAPLLALVALLVASSSLVYVISHPAHIHWELAARHLPLAGGGTHTQQSSIQEYNFGGSDGVEVAGGAAAGQTGEAASSSTGGEGRTLAERHALTKEMAAAATGGTGYVVVTWANWHYRDFVSNWVDHLKAAGCHSLIVGAMDDELLQYLLDQKVPTFSMSSNLTTGDLGWGSAAFHRMGREKINLIHAFTSMGISTVISDVDTVWMRDPVPFMKQYPRADVLLSSDCLRASATDGGLETASCWWDAGNIGVLMFRPSAINLTEAWVQRLEGDPKSWDQVEFNALRRAGDLPPVDGLGLAAPEDRYFWAFNKTLVMGILPVSTFASGHTFFVQRMAEKLHLDPYVVHATFQYSGTTGKKHRLREAMLWNDPDTYFEHPGGFIWFDPDIPQRLLDAAKVANPPRPWDRVIPLNETAPHFDLVNHQLSQIRAQFALATILGRAAVLPPIWVGLDRWWAAHPGEIPGSSHVSLPFLAPADHVLDLEWMDSPFRVKSLQEEEERCGPRVEWRAYSFLRQPQAARLNASSVTVAVCPDASDASCADGSAPAEVKDGTVRLRPWLDENQLAKALESIKDYKLVKVEGIVDAFAGFADPEKKKKFWVRAQHIGSLWCCTLSQRTISGETPHDQRGHVWYDLDWAEVPHTDRHNRVFRKPWEPMIGP